MNDYQELEKRVGYSFKKKDLLKEALTHRSYLNENPSWGVGHNERLEFLGDAALELASTEILFKKFPDKEEGELTVYRSALVNAKVLATVAKEIGLGNIVVTSRGEGKEIAGRGKETVMANALEALIGAIYLDGGYAAAKTFVERFVMVKLEEVAAGGKDAKSLVQEKAQSEFKITPTYKVHKEEGPAHMPVFRVGLYFGDRQVSEGIGSSKQEAELNAANDWLSESIKKKK